MVGPATPPFKQKMGSRMLSTGILCILVLLGSSYLFSVHRAGTHPSGQAKIVSTGETLSAWLRRYPTAVGAVAEGYPSDNLVFLLKILSIRTALSIQVRHFI